MSRFRQSIIVIGLSLLLGVACSGDGSTDPDINELLQLTNARWELQKKYTDADGSKVEMTYTVVFSAPNNYRWKEFGKRNGVDDPELSHEENGYYQAVETESKKGTITFTPGGGGQWEAAFEIMAGSGDLLITKADGTAVQFQYVISTTGIASTITSKSRTFCRRAENPPLRMSPA